MDKLVWVDLETTGLEPKSHRVLEMAMVITDYALVVIDEFSRVIKQPHRPAVGFRSAMPPEVLLMHQKSGLIDEVVDARYTIDVVESEMRVFMEAIVGPADPNIRKRPLMAGSSVHFDRSFLEIHMPELIGHFHYRNFDATSFGEAARLWFPNEFVEPEKQRLHRALPDLHDTLAELRYIKKTFFK
jgi:oligoribonuclease